MALKKSPPVEIRKSNGFPYFHRGSGNKHYYFKFIYPYLDLIPFGIKSGISTRHGIITSPQVSLY